MSLLRFLYSLRGNALVRVTSTVASLGFLVKLVALVKDMAIAALFGVGREMDIFTLAFGVASFPVTLLAGTLREAFLPVYVGLRSQERHAEAQALHQAVARRLLVGMLGVSLLIALMAPLWIPRMVPTWSPEDQARLRLVGFLLVAYLPLSGMAIHLTTLLHGQRAFIAPTLSPTLNSLGILGVILIPLHWGAFQLGVGVVVGSALDLCCLLWVLHWLNRQPVAKVPIPVESLRTVSRLYLPSLGASLFMCTTYLVDITIAGWLPPGAVSTLAYANKLPGVLIALTAGAIGTTLFPSFSHLAGLEQWRTLKVQAFRAVMICFAGSALVAVVLYFLSPWLVKLLYQRGSFGAQDVALVAKVQSVYFLQTPFYIGCVIVVRVIQALQQHRINLYGTIINGGLNWALDLAFLPALGVAGIALSTVCVYIVSFAFLGFWAYRLLKVRETIDASS